MRGLATLGAAVVIACDVMATGAAMRQAPAATQVAPASTLMAPGAQVEKLAGGFIFTEGPTADADGNVYFVDQDNNRIMKYDTAGTLSTYMQPSGYANGMTFDEQGHLIACADEKNEMWSIDIATKKPTVLFNTYESKLLNGPNDVWVHPQSGRIYFTDPYYARKWWNRGPKENPEAVYVYSRADKRMTRLIDDMIQPNGIIGTPDGKRLYVSDIRARKTFAYDIAADGSLSNKTLFAEMGSDGMTIDSEGNVYLTSGPAVQVFSPGGQQVENIRVPEQPANVCFGGKDKQTLFITARTGLYAVKLRVHGVGPQ
jgi:gluconolactonase